MTLYDDYKAIYEKFQILGKYLIKQLSKCEIEETTDKSFDYLVRRVADIKAVDHPNRYNVAPIVTPELTNENFTDFNISLAQRIRYYEKLLAYLLVKKGVSRYDVNNCTSLAELIYLIEFIDLIKHSNLTIDAELKDNIYIMPNETYGYAIPIPYILKDNDGNDIKTGTITIKYNDIIYYEGTAGDQAIFVPPSISEKVDGVYQPYRLEISYSGTKKYEAAGPIYVDVIVEPSIVQLDINASNITNGSKYYQNSSIGSEGDVFTFEIQVKSGSFLPDMPLEVSINNDTLQVVTDSLGIAQFNYSFNKSMNYLITVKSNCGKPEEITDSESTYNINIKYNILQPEVEDYIQYAGKTNEYVVEIHNEDTNEIDLSYDGQTIICVDEEDNIPLKIENGQVIYSKESLSATTFKLTWKFEQSDYNIYKNSNVTVLSNFTLPEENSFFLNTTPDIQYHPLGNITINKKAQVTIFSTVEKQEIIYLQDDNGEYVLDEDGNKLIKDITIYIEDEEIYNELYYTNSEGILHKIKDLLQAGQYKIKLTTASDNLNETVYYKYELKPPFTLNLADYKKKEYAQFSLLIDDIDDIDTIQYSLLNNGMIEGSYYEVLKNNDTSYTIMIPLKENQNIGLNTFKVTLNGYSIEKSFLLLTKYFDLLTESVEIGNSTIQILCYDNDITKLNIEDANGFSINGYYDRVYDENRELYIYSVDVTNTDTTTKSLVVSNNIDLTTDILALKVTPKDLTEYISTDIFVNDEYVEKDNYNFEVLDVKNGNIEIGFNIDTYIYNALNISYYYKKDTDSTNTQYTSFICQGGYEYLSVPSTLSVGNYTLKFQFNGDANHNAFEVSIDITIIKSQPTLITKLYTAYTDIDYGKLTLTQESSLTDSLTTTLIAQFINQLKEPISNQEVTFYINEAPISDITDLATSTATTDETGTASISYANLNEIVINIRVATKNQCSNVIVINTIKNILSQVENCYVEIVDENNELVITEKPANDIDSIDDLQGIIVDMGIDSDGNWQYDKFSSSSDNLSADEITQLSNALVGYLDENGELKITLLGDV